MTHFLKSSLAFACLIGCGSEPSSPAQLSTSNRQLTSDMAERQFPFAAFRKIPFKVGQHGNEVEQIISGGKNPFPQLWYFRRIPNSFSICEKEFPADTIFFGLGSQDGFPITGYCVLQVKDDVVVSVSVWSGNLEILLQPEVYIETHHGTIEPLREVNKVKGETLGLNAMQHFIALQGEQNNGAIQLCKRSLP